MRIATRFAAKFADSIVAILRCVDRLVFKRYLPFGRDGELNQFVDRLGIRRKDFLPQLLPTRRSKITLLGHRNLGACLRLYYHGLATAA